MQAATTHVIQGIHIKAETEAEDVTESVTVSGATDTNVALNGMYIRQELTNGKTDLPCFIHTRPGGSAVFDCKKPVTVISFSF